MIFVTARRRELEQVLGLELGADDYVTKPFDVEILLARIKAVLRRTRTTAQPLYDASSLIVGDLLIDAGTHSVQAGQRAVELGRREFDLLCALAQMPGHVFSTEELLTRVWGAEFARRAAGRLRPCAPPAREAGGRSQSPPVHPHRARHRLQAHGRGSRNMRSLRSRLILSHILPCCSYYP